MTLARFFRALLPTERELDKLGVLACSAGILFVIWALNAAAGIGDVP